MASIGRARPRAHLVLLLSCLAAATAVLTAAERTVLVSVLDDKEQPVEGLGVADIEVREDGVAREVLRVAPATTPLQIALLIDDSGISDRYIKDFRDGAKGFVNTITAAGKHQIAVITFGERSTLVRDYTSDGAALGKSIDRIFARTNAGMELLDALIDASKGLAKREETARKHIVVMMTEGVEFGTQHEQTVLDAINNAGATMHALVLTVGAASDMATEVRTRNLVLDVGTRSTGGRRDNLLAETAIKGAFASLAQELLAQYEVVYSRPDTLIPPEKLAVRTTRPGLTARAPTRAGK